MDAYRQIFAHVTNGVRENVLQQGKGFSRQAWNRITKNVVEQHLEALVKLRESDSTKEIKSTSIVAAHKDSLDELIGNIFWPSEPTQENRKALRKIFQFTIKSKALSNYRSGIVIAGFGEDEICPAPRTMETDGMVEKFLKHCSPRDFDIGRDDNHAVIMPFAQQEMVRRFMEGIDPEFHAYFGELFLEQLVLFGKGILEAHGLANDEFLARIRNVAEAQSSSYLKRARKFQNDRFIVPIMEIVRHLPKEELGGMAEALVNLTSLKRRVSQEQETVGGPVDVAVISKGDGFIWVKRKHYFDPSLNLHYVENRSRLCARGEYG
ncbi:MAG: hypothetical protein OXI01_22740 [Albidovulum sp.]|nr:hypothetical protein [Albidovulum sp.]